MGFRIPKSWMVYEKELVESIKNALTLTWSHLVDLSNGVKKLGGGGGAGRRW